MTRHPNPMSPLTGALIGLGAGAAAGLGYAAYQDSQMDMSRTPGTTKGERRKARRATLVAQGTGVEVTPTVFTPPAKPPVPPPGEVPLPMPGGLGVEPILQPVGVDIVGGGATVPWCPPNLKMVGNPIIGIYWCTNVPGRVDWEITAATVGGAGQPFPAPTGFTLTRGFNDGEWYYARAWLKDPAFGNPGRAPNPVSAGVWALVAAGTLGIGYAMWRCNPGLKSQSKSMIGSVEVEKTLTFGGCFQDKPWIATISATPQTSAGPSDAIVLTERFAKESEAAVWLRDGAVVGPLGEADVDAGGTVSGDGPLVTTLDPSALAGNPGRRRRNSETKSTRTRKARRARNPYACPCSSFGDEKRYALCTFPNCVDCGPCQTVGSDTVIVKRRDEEEKPKEAVSRGRTRGRTRRRRNPGKSDAQMAKFNLQQIAEYAAEIFMALDGGAQLPSWAEHKLNVARYKIDSAWHAWAFNQRQPNGSYMDVANASLLLDYAELFAESLKAGDKVEPWIAAYISEAQSDVKGVAHYLKARPDARSGNPPEGPETISIEGGATPRPSVRVKSTQPKKSTTLRLGNPLGGLVGQLQLAQARTSSARTARRKAAAKRTIPVPMPTTNLLQANPDCPTGTYKCGSSQPGEPPVCCPIPESGTGGSGRRGKSKITLKPAHKHVFPGFKTRFA